MSLWRCPSCLTLTGPEFGPCPSCGTPTMYAVIPDAHGHTDVIVVPTMQLVPRKNFRLHGGTKGTEYEALLEVIRHWEAKRQEAEDALERYRLELELAEGHP